MEIRTEPPGGFAHDAGVTSERERAAEIRHLAGRHHLGPLGERHVEFGTSAHVFRGVVLEALAASGSSKPLDTSPGLIGMTDRELRGITMADFVRAACAASPGGQEFANANKRQHARVRELSNEVQKRTPRKGQGTVSVPLDIWLRDAANPGAGGYLSALETRVLTASGGVASGGAVVQSTVMGSQYVPPNYNVPAVVRAGARMLTGLTGNVEIPAMTAGKSGTWVNPENTAVTSADATFAQIALTPHDLGTVGDISRRLLLQSSPHADALVRDDIAVALSNGVDQAAINGTGASGQPQGILGASGLNIQPGGTNGAALNLANCTYLPQFVGQANRLLDDGSTAFIANGQTVFHAARTQILSGSIVPRYLIDDARNPTLAGRRVVVSQNVPFNLTKGSGSNLSALLFGHWEDLLIGEWGVLDLLVDPYTFSNTGAIRIRAFVTVDIKPRYLGAFSAINDIVTT